MLTFWFLLISIRNLEDQLEIDMLKITLHEISMLCIHTCSMSLIILMYVTIDGFSYSNSDESSFDPMLGWLMDRNDKNDYYDSTFERS